MLAQTTKSNGNHHSSCILPVRWASQQKSQHDGEQDHGDKHRPGHETEQKAKLPMSARIHATQKRPERRCSIQKSTKVTAMVSRIPNMANPTSPNQAYARDSSTS